MRASDARQKWLYWLADPRSNPDEVTAQPEKELDSLVVVGSSAGGIEALVTLIAALPSDFPAPLVLAQHLDPRHRSHLAEILGRHSLLPVRTISNNEPLQPGVVYVVPADHHVEITDRVVRLRDQHGKGPKPSIDLLLSTAAAAFGERLIAVILTGSGSDGASGAHAVKAAGGTVVIENPATAAYPAMPASLASATVDIVADLERIGPLLSHLLAGTTIPVGLSTTAPLQALLDQVRDRHGIDFTRYKQPTIERRLQRRLVATGLSDVNEYLRYLQ
ncbi:MAG TPA: chemotaxis protein CheB, partial [Ktedonobacterales bacterium]|nr:chemotaxis protein CheB [Ktedonobacterales bacterium]